MTETQLTRLRIEKSGAIKDLNEVRQQLQSILTAGKNVEQGFQSLFNGKQVKELANALKEIKVLLAAVQANPGADLQLAKARGAARDVLASYSNPAISAALARGKAQKDLIRAAREDQINSYYKLQTPSGGKLSQAYVKQLQDVNTLKQIEEGLERRIAAQRDKTSASTNQTLNLLKETRNQKELIVAQERAAAQAAKEAAAAQKAQLKAAQQLTPLQKIQQSSDYARLGLRYSYANKNTQQSYEDLGMRAELAHQQRSVMLAGDGGASLFAIQARLIANYTLLNKFTQMVRFAVTSTVQLDAELKQLQAITASTDVEMGKLSTRLLDVAQSTKFTGTEVAQAATTLGQAGLSVSQIGDAIEPISKFASAVGTDLNTAVDVTTTTISAFNMQWSETPRVTDIMTTALNKSKLSMQQMQLALSYVANTASQVNVPFEELITSVGLLANAGVRSGSTIGTGLNQLLLEFASPSDNFKKELKLVGLNVEDVDVRSKGLVNTLKTLRDAGFGVTEGLKSFDVRSARSFAALLNQLDSADGFQKSLNTIGSTSQANAVQMEALTNKFANLQSAVTTFVATAGAPFIEVLKKVTDGLTSVFQWLNEYPTILKVVGAGFTTIATGAFAGWLTQIGVAVVRNIAFLRDWRASMMAVGAAAEVTAGGVSAATGALTTFGRVLTLASRVTLVTSVVIGLGQALYALYSYFKDGNDTLDKAKASVNELTDTYTSYLNTISSIDQAISDVAMKARMLNSDQDSLNQTTENLASRFMELGEYIGDTATNAQQLIDKLLHLRQLAINKTLFTLDKSIEAKKTLADEQSAQITLQSSQKAVWDKLYGIDLAQFGILRSGMFQDVNTSRATNSTVAAVVEYLRQQRPQSTYSPEYVSGQINSGMSVRASLRDLIAQKQGENDRDAVATLAKLRDALDNVLNPLQNLGETFQKINEEEKVRGDTAYMDTAVYKDAARRTAEVQIMMGNLKQAQADTKDASERYSLFTASGAKSANYKEIISALEKQISGLADGAGKKQLEDDLSTIKTAFEGMKQEALDNYVNYIDRFRKLESDAANRRLQEIKSRINKTTNADEILEYQKEAQGILNDEWHKARAALEKKLQADAGLNPDDTVKAEMDNSLKELDAGYQAKIDDINNQFSTAFEATRGQALPIKDALTRFNERVAKISRDYENALLPSQAAVKSHQFQIDAASNDLNKGTIGSAQVFMMQKEQYRLETEALRVQKEALAVKLRQIQAAFEEAKLKADAAQKEYDQQAAIVNSNTSKEGLALAQKKLSRAQSEANGYSQQAIALEKDLNDVRQQLTETTGELGARTEKLVPTSFAETYTNALAMWREQVNSTQSLTFRIGEALPEMFSSVSEGFADMAVNFAMNSKSIGESARNMALMFVEAMLKIAAQQASMSLLNPLFSAIGSAFGGGTTAGSTASNVVSQGGFNFTTGFLSKRHGGPIRRARGGSVVGKIKTRDSVHTLLQPEEYVLQKSAVDAIGVDTLDYLNANAAALSQRSGSAVAAAGAGRQQPAQPVMQNVYVVLPEEKPQIGPNDILTVVNDDIRRGGKTKQLVKQVMLGR